MCIRVLLSSFIEARRQPLSKMKGMKMQQELCSIKETCAILNCGTTNLYKILNSGRLKAVKLNRKTLIPRVEINKYITSLDTYKPQKTRGV